MGIVTLVPEFGKVGVSAWPHQERALEFLDGHRGALLAVAMGGGKSYVTIRTMIEQGWQRTLIQCPKSVMGVWPKEIGKHALCPFRVLTLDKGTCAQKAAELEAAIRAPDDEHGSQLVVLVNYESAWREPLASALARARFDAMVLDESHRVKSPGGKASKFCSRLAYGSSKALPIPWRVGLTGTPMPHSPLDVYGQLRALDRRVFGTSFTAFKARYAVMGGFEGREVKGWQNMDEFTAKLAGVTFQVGAGVLNLEPPVHMERFCSLEPKAARLYEGLETELIAEIDEGTVTAANALSKLIRLRQVSGGFTRIGEGREAKDIEIGSHKTDLLADVLEDMGPAEAIVVFGVFRHDLDAIHQAAERSGRTSLELSGRRNELAEWQAGGGSVLAVQLQAGGVGVDLTRARYCIYFSVGFSLGDYSQSLARLQRPGQTRRVVYIHLIAQRTVDEAVYRALAKKEDIVSAVLASIRSGQTEGSSAYVPSRCNA